MMEMITKNHLNGPHNEDINSSVIHTHTHEACAIFISKLLKYDIVQHYFIYYYYRIHNIYK